MDRSSGRGPRVRYLLAVTLALVALAGLGACGGTGTRGQSQAQGSTESSQGSTSSSSPDWDAAGQALGKDLESKGEGVYEAQFPRTDLRVSAGNVELDPSLDLGSELYFKQIDNNGSAMAMGELVLTENEVDPVITQLEQGGVEMTALHKHQPDESPSLWWMHVQGSGDPVQVAKTLRSALDKTGTPINGAGGGSFSQRGDPKQELDTRRLDQTIGYEGQVEGGVYKFDIPRAETITDTMTNATIPPEMGAAGASELFFQPTGGGKAVANGELCMTANEVNPVAQALRNNNIQVVSMHNHHLNEEPRLFFMHFWGNDDATTLAQGLRAALDKMNVGKSSAGG